MMNLLIDTRPEKKNRMYIFKLYFIITNKFLFKISFILLFMLFYFLYTSHDYTPPGVFLFLSPFDCY